MKLVRVRKAVQTEEAAVVAVPVAAAVGRGVVAVDVAAARVVPDIAAVKAVLGVVNNY
jgi:hypothetical protein